MSSVPMRAPEGYAAAVADHTLTDCLASYPVHPGDCFFLPAGRVHAIGAGALIAEIQQTSDITYRIYDYDRRDAQGRPRELHTELAREAIDYTVLPDYRTHYTPQPDRAVELVRCRYFTTQLCVLTRPFRFDWSGLDSFVAVICTAGRGTLTDDRGNRATLHRGETLLVPACVRTLQVEPQEPMTLLTSHIDR